MAEDGTGDKPRHRDVLNGAITAGNDTRRQTTNDVTDYCSGESTPRSGSSSETVVLFSLAVLCLVITLSLPWFVLFVGETDGVDRRAFHLDMRRSVVCATENSKRGIGHQVQSVEECLSTEDELKIVRSVAKKRGGRKRTIRLNDNFPEVWVQDLARSPVTGRLFLSGMTADNRVLIRLNERAEPEAFFKLDPFTEGDPYVSVTDEGEVVLTSPTNRVGHIHFLNEAGEELRRLETGRTVTGCVVDVRGRLIYVAQPFERRLAVYSLNGTLVRTIGAGLLEYPQSVALGTGRVYVSDLVAEAVFVFSKSGELVDTLRNGQNGVGISPRGLHVEPALRKIFVADRENNSVHVYDIDSGRWITTITGSEGGGAWRPVGVATLSSGQLVVASEYTDELQVLELPWSGR